MIKYIGSLHKKKFYFNLLSLSLCLKICQTRLFEEQHEKSHKPCLTRQLLTVILLKQIAATELRVVIHMKQTAGEELRAVIRFSVLT